MKASCLVLILLGFAAAVAPLASGADKKGGQQIDFEGDVVEGVNKQPLDSLSQLADEAGGNKNSHLYRRKKAMPVLRGEIEQSLREVAETR